MLTIQVPNIENLDISDEATPLKRGRKKGSKIFSPPTPIDAKKILENNNDTEYVKISKEEYDEMLRVYSLYVSKAKNRSDRWYQDEDYRRKRLDSMNSYSKKRYQEDPEYREKRKNQAKDRWRRKKISGELSNGCNTPSSDASSMNNSLELSPSNALENSGTPTQFE